MNSDSVSFFNGGDVHKKIFLLFPPVTWCLVFSRVCRQWRHTSKSDTLWLSISRRLIERVPSLDTIEVDGYPKGYRGREWCRYCYYCEKIPKGFRFVQELAILNIPPSLVTVLKLHNVGYSPEYVRIVYNGVEVPEMDVHVEWSSFNRGYLRAFLVPIRQLILHGYTTPSEFLLREGNRAVARICIETLKIRRAKKRKKRKEIK